MKLRPTTLAITWWLLPYLLLFGLSRTMGLGLFVDRYALWGAGGSALLLSSTFSDGRAAAFRGLRASVLTALLVLVQLPEKRAPEGWREGAADIANRGITPVLLYSGIAESANVAWLEDPARREYLTAPLNFYHAGNDILPLPFRIDPSNEVVIQNMVRLADARFSFIGLNIELPGEEYSVDRYHRLFQRYGYECHDTSAFGMVRVSSCHHPKQPKS
jgi:hypothetical protein